jgi:hypothetical protein
VNSRSENKSFQTNPKEVLNNQAQLGPEDVFNECRRLSISEEGCCLSFNQNNGSFKRTSNSTCQRNTTVLVKWHVT